MASEPRWRRGVRVEGGDGEDADGAGEDVHGEERIQTQEGLGFGADSDEGEVGNGEVDEAVVDEARRERAGPLRAADEGVVHLGEAEKRSPPLPLPVA